jgi:hypothetical protein
MNLTKITPIESNNQRVLTTAQIAEAYGTTTQIITNNFNRNKARYKEGKHYYLLKGALLQAFKTTNQNDLLLNRVNTLYLWTESGALLHAKSLNTNKAWDVYVYLVDFYFRVKTALVEQLQAQVAHLLRSATIAVGEQERLRIAARANILALFGGKNTVSYKLYALRVYKSLWREYRKHFRLDSYRNTPEYRFSEGLDFIRAWEPGKWQRNAIKSIEKDFMNFLETFFDDKDKDGYRRLLADCPAIVEEYINAIR